MFSGHLSIEEVGQLSQQKGPAENQSHIRAFRRCHGSPERHKAKLDKLASVRIGAKKGMNCPDERVWFDVAAGTLSSEENLRYVQHAAECESCAQKLRTATRIFQEELTPEEEERLDALPSASTQQQKKLAEKLSRATDRQSQSSTSGKRKR